MPVELVEAVEPEVVAGAEVVLDAGAVPVEPVEAVEPEVVLVEFDVVGLLFEPPETTLVVLPRENRLTTVVVTAVIELLDAVDIGEVLAVKVGKEL